jgi:4-amino-4-deoxy-L-arabinose transferase and related glycosyltransferases of PMT family
LRCSSGFAIPNLVVDSKQPQSLVDTVRMPLEESRFVLANNVGVASGLAWELNRHDIILFGQTGELKYGLGYPDVKGRFVSNGDIAQWLDTHRQQGPVSLMILLSKNDDIARAGLPKPDSLTIQGRLAYLQYLPQ